MAEHYSVQIKLIGKKDSIWGCILHVIIHTVKHRKATWGKKFALA